MAFCKLNKMKERIILELKPLIITWFQGLINREDNRFKHSMTSTKPKTQKYEISCKSKKSQQTLSFKLEPILGAKSSIKKTILKIKKILIKKIQNKKYNNNTLNKNRWWRIPTTTRWWWETCWKNTKLMKRFQSLLHWSCNLTALFKTRRFQKSITNLMKTLHKVLRLISNTRS